MRQSGLTRDPIDTNALLQRVLSPSVGAISLFVGTVREHNDGKRVTGIEYSAYDAMAELEMARILAEAAELFPGVRLAMQHRLGALTVGDASIAIAAAHERRAAAMDAMRFVIETVKVRVPIWKREWYVDGTREWVDPTQGAAAGVATEQLGAEGSRSEREYGTTGERMMREIGASLANFPVGGAPPAEGEAR